MPDRLASFKNSGRNQVLFILSIITILYWLTAKSSNVYNNAFIGAVFELLWLPMIAFAFIGPVFSTILFVKDKYNPGSLVLYAAVLQIIALYILIVFKSN
ncbi:MAG: hypothetical protein B7X75_06830 [Sphingobacteriales bacterium 39-40-5]|nr:MAG: hypothetical protein B7X75_06830 [Sphingobacteriales bacterium 39-40-5]HQS52451.1 hypothetical protein [Daejeonella sp.]